MPILFRPHLPSWEPRPMPITFPSSSRSWLTLSQRQPRGWYRPEWDGLWGMPPTIRLFDAGCAGPTECNWILSATELPGRICILDIAVSMLRVRRDQSIPTFPSLPSSHLAESHLHCWLISLCTTMVHLPWVLITLGSFRKKLLKRLPARRVVRPASWQQCPREPAEIFTCETT